MFGSHHDDAQDTNQPDTAQAPVGGFGQQNAGPSAPPAPAGFGQNQPDPALDDLAAQQEPEEPTAASPPSPSLPPEPHDNANEDDLLDIKQAALKRLEPLVDKLEQTPEEKFRTTMMLIQATDDKSKIKDAYVAAQDIKDEKERAQALLDVVNEINYFSQKEES